MLYISVINLLQISKIELSILKFDSNINGF